MVATLNQNARFKVIWELEELQLRKNTVFVSGWLFITEHSLQSLEFQIHSASSQVVSSISLEASKPRPDVLKVHPAIPESLHSGFVGIGSWARQPQVDDQLVLLCHLTNGKTTEVIIPAKQWQSIHSLTPWQRRRAYLRQLLSYCKRGLRLATSGQIKTLIARLKRFLSEQPQQRLPSKLTWADLKDLGITPKTRLHLIVDHRLGGGANHYKDEMVKPWLEAGDAVLTLTFHLSQLSPMLVVQMLKEQRRYRLENTHDLTFALSEISLDSITYNTAVSFAEPDAIPKLLLALQANNQAILTVVLHDYFSICPSQFLLDASGSFCGIPDLSVCNQCLPRNPHGFTSLFHGDIIRWRESWGPLLREADHIVAFSESSVQLLRRAYEHWPEGKNWLNGRIITVRPHSVNYLCKKVVNIKNTDHLVIGVIGHISFHKGAEVVRRIAELISQQNSDERIVVIGSIEGPVDRKIVSQRGHYKRERLADAIEESGANVMLFPSICPETFSYVTEEIIQLNLPVACLNLGAPAERISRYDKGIVLESHEPLAILQSLNKLFRSFYPS